MDLREYLVALRKRWYLVAALAVVGALIGLYQGESTAPTYKASAKTFVSLSRGSNTQELVQGTTYTQNLVQSYAALATMPAVLDPVIEKLHLPVTAKSLAGSVTATTPLNTVIIEVDATSRDRKVAADVANAVAEQLSATISQLAPRPEDDPVRLTLVSPASEPRWPIAPNKKMLLALGLIAGLATGVALAVIRVLFDTRIRDADDVADATDAPVLGSIPRLRTRGGRAVTAISPLSVASESYRRLQTNLQFLDASSPLRSIVISSSVGGEGKSTTAINLALTIAEKGLRVLLVDADMRRPAIATYCGLEGSVGLTTVLIGKAELHDVVQGWGQATLRVLPLGELPPNPGQLIGSPRMAALLQQASEEFDYVLLDTPPLLPVSDGAILTRMCDGALIVANCRRTHRHHLTDALATLESVDARPLGIVANNVRASAEQSYYGKPAGRFAGGWLTSVLRAGRSVRVGHVTRAVAAGTAGPPPLTRVTDRDTRA